MTVKPTPDAPAVVPLKVTSVAPVKAVPVITTDVVVTGPLEGVKLVMDGAATTVKSAAEVPVPPVLLTATVPVVAPEGTVTVIVVAEFTVQVNAAVPLKVTFVTLVNPVPVMTTVSPTLPEVGSKVIEAGVAGRITRSAALVAVPPVVLTTIRPVEAPTGTVSIVKLVPDTTV